MPEPPDTADDSSPVIGGQLNPPRAFAHRQPVYPATLRGTGTAGQVLLEGTIDTAFDHPLAEHFQSLDPAVRLQPPVAANMSGALKHLLDQALSRL